MGHRFLSLSWSEEDQCWLAHCSVYRARAHADNPVCALARLAYLVYAIAVCELQDWLADFFG